MVLSSEFSKAYAIKQISHERKVGFFDFGKKEGFPVIFFGGHFTSALAAKVADSDARQNNIRIVAVDRPGIGNSTFYNYSFSSVAEDTRALLDYIGIGKCGVIAASGGSPYGLGFAGRNQERVQFLALISGLAPFSIPNGYKNMALLPRIYFSSRNEIVPGLFLKFAQKFPQVILNLPDNSPQRRGFETKKILLADLGQTFAQGVGPTAYERNLYKQAWSDVLWKNIECPTLVLHGKQDSVTNAHMAEHNHQRIKSSRLVMYEGDHFFFVNQFNQVLKEILTLRVN